LTGAIFEETIRNGLISRGYFSNPELFVEAKASSQGDAG